MMNENEKLTDGVQPAEARSEIMSALYDAADEMKRLEPWNTFCEVDLCEIYLKYSDEPYYCSFSGMFEDEYGVSVYRGHEGLISMSNVINASELPEYIAASRKNCLECVWVSREELTRRDLTLVKLAGKKYRGAGSWPLMRIFETGYEPYYLDEEEAMLLTEIMTQFNKAMNELQLSGELDDISEGERIRRSYNAEEECWVNELVAPIEQIKAVTDGCVITDELLIRRLMKKKNTGRSLEFDMPFLPVPVNNEDGREGRRRFPRLCIACDPDRGAVENQYYINNMEDPRDIALGMVVNYIESKGKPVAIYVRDTELFGVLGHLCGQIGVELCFSPMLKMLDFFVDDIIEQFHNKD